MDYKSDSNQIEEFLQKKDYFSVVLKCVKIFENGIRDILKKYLSIVKNTQHKNEIIKSIEHIEEKYKSLTELTLDELIDLENAIELFFNLKKLNKENPNRIKAINFKSLLEYKDELLKDTSKIREIDARFFLANLTFFVSEFEFLKSITSTSQLCPDCGNPVSENTTICPSCQKQLEEAEDTTVTPDFIFKLTDKIQDLQKNQQKSWEALFFNNTLMVYIPEGEFIMGCEADYSFLKERPEHNIYLSPYWISKHEVTFTQFDQYCQEAGIPKPTDEEWGRSDQPVINVSWIDAAKYCEWLSDKTGLIFRLPTEAEWEKAARGIDKRKYPWGNNDPDVETANFEYSMRKTSPVDHFPKGVSPYGVMDMSGNVWEWCYDLFDESFYKASPPKNPTGPEIGTSRVIRGGGWGYDSSFLRTTNRNRWKPEEFNNDIGFRIVLSHYTPSGKIKDGLTIERF